MILHFYNTFLNSFSIASLFSGGIMILFPINLPIASAALCSNFYEEVLKAFSPVVVAVSNNCFPYLLNRFLENDKKPCPLTYFFVLGSTE